MSVRSRWYLLLIVPLIGSLRFEVFVRTGAGKDYLNVVVPARGMAIVRGKGVFRSSLYPGNYRVEGKIEGDSLLVFRAMRVEKVNPIALRLDEFIRNRVLSPLDYYMVRALLLGLRKDMPKEVREDFRKTGNFHLLAISGLHTGILFMAFVFLLSMLYIPLKWRYFIGSILVGLYGWVVSFPPSVFRAFLFVFIFALSRLMERKTSALNILGLAALIALLADPSDAYRAGFQLSYAATFGILYTFDYRGAGLFRKFILNPLKVAISAQLYTTPVLLMHFGRAYPFFFFSSLITVPLTFMVILVAVLSLAFFFLPPMWASLHIAVMALVGFVHLLSDLPLPSLDFELPPRIVVAYLISITILISLVRKWIKIRRT